MRVALVVLAMSVVVPRTTAAQEKPSARLFVVQEMGTLHNTSLSIDGREQEAEGANFYFGFHAGYSHGFSDAAALVVQARLGLGPTGWSEDRGENRYFVDLVVGPEFRFARRPSRPWHQAHLSFPVGITMLRAEPGPSRQVRNSDATGFGPSLAVDLGYDLAGLHHGVTLGASYLLHLTWMNRTSTLVSEPDARIEERERRIDHLLMLNIGWLYRL
jgi:hypothetical protein